MKEKSIWFDPLLFFLSSKPSEIVRFRNIFTKFYQNFSMFQYVYSSGNAFQVFRAQFVIEWFVTFSSFVNIKRNWFSHYREILYITHFHHSNFKIFFHLFTTVSILYSLFNSSTHYILNTYIYSYLFIACYIRLIFFLFVMCIFHLTLLRSLSLSFLQRKSKTKLKISIFPRLKLQLRRQSQFNARKKFQYAILCVRAMVRIKRLRYTLEPLRMEDSLKDPYRVKVLRKVSSNVSLKLHLAFDWFEFLFWQVIDGCAFRVYGHWVKKGEGQNRAALFENTPRTELHTLYLANLSR